MEGQSYKANDGTFINAPANYCDARKYYFKNPEFIINSVRTLMILCILVWVLALFSGITEGRLLDNIKKEAFASESEMQAAADASDRREFFVGIGQMILSIVTFIFLLIWIHRSNNNLRAVTGEQMKFTPGWSVGWFFIPIACLWKPFQALKEIWLVSAKHSGRQYRGYEWVSVWWTLWLISSFLNRAAFRLQIQAKELDQIMQANSFTIAADVVDIIYYGVLLVMVSKIISMQLQIRVTPQSTQTICQELYGHLR